MKIYFENMKHYCEEWRVNTPISYLHWNFRTRYRLNLKSIIGCSSEEELATQFVTRCSQRTQAFEVNNMKEKRFLNLVTDTSSPKSCPVREKRNNSSSIVRILAWQDGWLCFDRQTRGKTMTPFSQRETSLVCWRRKKSSKYFTSRIKFDGAHTSRSQLLCGKIVFY